MTISQAIFLGVVQGATEFLPVSSSAHLMIIQHWMGLAVNDSQIFFDLIVHLGTLLSIVLVLHKELLAHLRERQYWLWIALALLPTIVIGLLLRHLAEYALRLPVIASLLIGNALILWQGHRASLKNSHRALTPLLALAIGVAQGIAVLPGFSRSGLTITAALCLGVAQREGFTFSFLLAIPTILMALSYEVFTQMSAADLLPSMILLSGFLSSCLVGTFSLYLLKQFMTQKRLNVFVVYCAALGLWVLLRG